MNLRLVRIARAALSLAFPALAAAQSGSLTNDQIPFDNLRDRQVNFETAPIQPMTFSADGSVLYAVNQPGSRLASLNPDTLARGWEIPIGLGAVTVVRRPGTNELWVVDTVSACISVVDPALSSIVRTIPVGAEPHGLVFTPAGDSAFVTCSAVDRVDVISTARYGVRKSIAIPARCPRGIVYLNGKVYVVAFRSGNGTVPVGTIANPNGIVGVLDDRAVAGYHALPDRDLFVIDTQGAPNSEALVPAATVSGLGTILFNLHVRPGTSELWIPNTEALNAAVKGEVNFVGGQVVRNRISIVDANGASAPRIVDLDAIAPPDQKCGQPSYVAFDTATSRAFVCSYGNDLVAVLRLGPGTAVTWEGSIQIPPKQTYPRGTGPRACLVDTARNTLIVFNKNDGSATRVPLASLPTSGVWNVTAPIASTLGFDPTADEERLGRHLFTNARFSASQTSSCASCHVDGHTDGLAWDLSHYLDPEGTPSGVLQCGTDVKGPLVTQSARRLEESGPYHWRGEKRHLDKFQSAFVDLLENTQQGVVQEIGPDFQYMRHYVDRLAYPPNPKESADRLYTASQLAGATVFVTRPVSGALTCSSCHQLPLGSGGEITPVGPGGVATSADVPQLRGVADKLTPALLIGGPFGTRSELGAGLTHGGAFATFQTAISGSPAAPEAHRFNLTPQEADSVAEFLMALDTGVAPSAVRQVTANAGNWATLAAGDLAFLRTQAEHGDCDLVYYRTPRIVLGQMSNMTGVYDTVSHKFRVASGPAWLIDQAVLLQEAASGSPVTFLGVPVGMGKPKGLDRDMDELLDLDEIARGTNPEDPDADHDQLPDGYEVVWGTNPLAFTTSTLDTQPPALLGPARLIYATTNTLKLEFDTSEACRVNVSYNGGYPVVRTPLGPMFDDRHFVILTDLQADTVYQIRLDMKDPSSNQASDLTTQFRTKPRQTQDPTRVGSIVTSLVPGAGGTTVLHADVGVRTGAGPVGAGYQVIAGVYRVLASGTNSVVAASVTANTIGTGVATFQVTLPGQGGGPPGTVWFVVKDVQVPPGRAPYAVGYSTQTTGSQIY